MRKLIKEVATKQKYFFFPLCFALSRVNFYAGASVTGIGTVHHAFISNIKIPVIRVRLKVSP